MGDKSFSFFVAEINDGFPLEVRLVSAEVTSGCSFLIDRTPQIEIPDDHSGSEIEVAVYDSLQIFIREP